MDRGVTNPTDGFERRMKRITFHPQIFHMMLTEGEKFTVKKGIPEGSKYQGMWMDPHKLCFHIYFSHPSFEKIPTGKDIPEIETEFWSEG